MTTYEILSLISTWATAAGLGWISIRLQRRDYEERIDLSIQPVPLYAGPTKVHYEEVTITNISHYRSTTIEEIYWVQDGEKVEATRALINSPDPIKTQNKYMSFEPQELKPGDKLIVHLFLQDLDNSTVEQSTIEIVVKTKKIKRSVKLSRIDITKLSRQIYEG